MAVAKKHVYFLGGLNPSKYDALENKINLERYFSIFSAAKAALEMQMSVRPSVRPSVCPSVRVSSLLFKLINQLNKHQS